MLYSRTTRQSSKALAFSVIEGCRKGPDETADAHTKMTERIRSSITDNMDEFNKRNTDKPKFRVFHQYIKLILMILIFIKATREGNWDLHLVAEGLAKYFFALDISMLGWSLHLEETVGEIWREFKSSNIRVTKMKFPFVPLALIIT